MPNVSTLGRTLLTVTAQGLSSVTNFAAGALALVAADGDLAAFGRYSIAFQLCQVTIAVAQGSTGSAVLIHSARDSGTFQANDIRAGAATATLVIGGVIGVILGAAAVWVGGEIRTPLLIAAIGSPFLVAQYTLRAARFAQQDPAGVARADGIWLAVLLAAVAGDAFGGWDPTPSGYLAAWVVGAAVSSLPLLLIAVGPGRRHLSTFWAATGPQAVRTGFDGLLARSVFVVTLIFTELIVGDEASGVLAAAVLLFSPLSVVHSTVLALVVPSTIRDKGIHVTGRRLPLSVFALIGVVTTGWAITILVIDATPLAFGPFDLSEAEVTTAVFVATLLRFLGMAFWRGPVVAMRVADAAGEGLRARAIGTTAQWVFPVLGLLAFGLNGGAFGLSLATWFGALVAWRHYALVRGVPRHSIAASGADGMP